MQTTRFVVFQLAHFLLFFFSDKYLIGLILRPPLVVQIKVYDLSSGDPNPFASTLALFAKL